MTERATDEWVEAWIGTDEEIEERIAWLEQEWGMSAEEFLAAKKRGDIPNSFAAGNFVILLRYRRKTREHITA